MIEFRREVSQVQRALQMLLYSEVRHLERALNELTPTQRRFITEALATARAEGRLPSNVAQTLEYLQERWNTHGLAVKLAFIERIERLSESRSWPGDVRSQYPALKALAREKVMTKTAPPTRGRALA